MATVIPESYHPNFLKNLRRSRVAVNKAADWLSADGYAVIIKPVFERPDISQIDDYSDLGDLEIVQRVEVKWRGIKFTSVKDFPYPTIIVDACRCYDQAHPKPHGYVLYSTDLLHAVFINVRETIVSWKKVAKDDHEKGVVRNFYECPIELGKFLHAYT